MKLKEKMKNNNHKKFDKKKLIGTISKKHIKNGSYTMAMSVIFIAVVVVLNMIVNAIPSKYSEIDISSHYQTNIKLWECKSNAFMDTYFARYIHYVPCEELIYLRNNNTNCA